MIVKKSSKSGKSSNASILRFIEPSNKRGSLVQNNGPASGDNELSKAQSYIESTRAQAPEPATALSKESSGALAFGLATSLFVIALSFVAASAVLV